MAFACGRADHFYGGNFSAYVLDLVEQDRSISGTYRTRCDVEAQIHDAIKPHGGRPHLGGRG